PLRLPTALATPQEKQFRVSSLELRVELGAPTVSQLETRFGCGYETRTLTPSFTRRALCYPIELRRNLVDWERFKPSQEVCRTSMLSVTCCLRDWPREELRVRAQWRGCLLMEIC